MRKLVSILLVVCIAISCVCVAYGEGGAESKAFAPMPELTPVKIVVGYNEAALGGHLPSENYWLKVVKDYLNIDVQYMWEVPDVQYAAKLSNSLASGQYPDFISVDAATYKMLLEADALVDLTDLWNEYASDAIKRSFAKVDEVWSSVTVDGKLMAIPYYGDPAQNMNVMYYRQDWLDRVNMEVPTSFEDFIKVVKAFRDNDPDGNGEKDTYGMVLTANPFTTSISYLPIFYAFNAYPGSWILKDGKVVNGNVQPEVKDALDCLRELYKEGYIDPEFATLAYDQAYADVTAGNAGIISHKWYVSCIKDSSYKNVPDLDWIPAPLYVSTFDQERG